MAKNNKNQPWKEKWIFVKDLGSGGQGYTQVVKHKDTTASEEFYVLKTLKNQEDAERRKRMHREVTDLKTLDSPSIPKVIDSNSEEFNSNVPLYMVTEYIEGNTLKQQILEQGVIDFSVAINFIKNLLKVIEYCHESGIFHRDIKPDNIIIRNNKLDDPVLIDFGISFNEIHVDETDLTGTWQQLGNRFLGLPEFRLKSNFQRDPRSDITQSCGILFFMLTALYPVELRDQEEKKPHQRHENKKILSKISADYLRLLNTIFDRAFEWQLDQRWQSIPELEIALSRLSEPIINEQKNDIRNSIEAIRNQLYSSPDYTLKSLFKSLVDKIVKEIRDTGFAIGRELGDGFSPSITTGGDEKLGKIDFAKLRFIEQFNIENIFSNKNFVAKFIGYATANEIVVLSERNEEKIELLRVSLNGEPDLVSFRERLRSFYLKGVETSI
ncbi:serine/threonine-protein kinase (plasmid) [Nostoc sp. UHCC 0926]|uniref:serine/threonine protein kinase n=1 Tax=Nostoc sp. UHCC 0926 TaxID=3025190 RepID=UPI00235EF0E9|nr:serine/threonine-protein kinase [Nostoc sp. UHCC 0926]WDD36251.1 serine/threonine-protein kinase [Nostoc sp. UHCC 0926]